MSIPNETLKAMIRDYNGIELSDEELELVRPELESYFAELKKLEDLDPVSYTHLTLPTKA